MECATPYKISTITATARLNSCLDLDQLFDLLEIANNVLYIEYGSRKLETRSKGEASKQRMKYKNTVPKKLFNNQMTVVFQMDHDGYGSIKTNCKIFKNGHVQMTGLKFVEQGLMVIKKLIPEIGKANDAADNKIFLDEINELSFSGYMIRLINCDFRVGFKLRRDVLHKLVSSSGDYKVFSSFEPCIYPGCKIQYWYNTESDTRDGCCYCVNKCNGKGCGSGDGECKKITVAVFQSGCVIITGGQSHAQIDETYKFISKCLRDNYETIKKPEPSILT
jgi:TATA-box binding protein (TBP) (component of TFIID and TFIIIB)